MRCIPRQLRIWSILSGTALSDTAAFEATVTKPFSWSCVQRFLCMRGQELDSCSKKKWVLASFCRETHAFVPMGDNYPIKPGQIDGRHRHSPSHSETILSPRPQARLEHWLVAGEARWGSFRRERKIEAILLSGFSFARRSLHQQVRDLHEVVGKHGRRDPHLKTFAAFGKAAFHATTAEQHRDTPLDARSEALAVLELRALLIGFSLGRFGAAALWD